MEIDPAPYAAPDLPPPTWGSLRAALAAVRRPFVLRWVEHSLFLVALLGLGFCAFSLLDSARFEQVQERRLQHLGATATTSRPPLATGPRRATATRAEASDTGLVGRLEMSRLGLSAIVSEGTDGRTLRRAVGHLPGTAFPGESGNVVLAAHRDRHFRPLRNARAGDFVLLTTPDGTFQYRVEYAAVVEPEDTEHIAEVDAPVLTLVTCYPFHYVGDAPQRFVVRAALVTDTTFASATARKGGAAKPTRSKRTKTKRQLEPPVDTAMSDLQAESGARAQPAGRKAGKVERRPRGFLSRAAAWLFKDRGAPPSNGPGSRRVTPRG
jgi:sortase A